MSLQKTRARTKNHPELFWPRVMVRKWLNISAKDSDYGADTDSDSERDEDSAECERDSRPAPGDYSQVDPNDFLPKHRRRKSETFRAQYINRKEIRICVATWNVGAKLPPIDLDIDEWIDNDEPADIYVLGLQEIVPLNACNIFGAEDCRPVPKWENIIRETLNRVQPARDKVKCYSDPPSPTKFRPLDDLPDIEEEMLLESDSDIGEEIHPLDEDSCCFDECKERISQGNLFRDPGCTDYTKSRELGLPVELDLPSQYSSAKNLDRVSCFRTELSSSQSIAPAAENKGKLIRMLSARERIGLSWPEAPLDLLSQNVLLKPNSFKSARLYKATKSLGTYRSFKLNTNDTQSELALLAEIDLKALRKRKRKPSYVRIVSKQMVGVFLTIWVRRSLRRHIQNLKVSTVGVGIMGYIGNKGSISVSMSIHQSVFCFICTHLTSGEKDRDEIKRNADVHEIHKRTQFRAHSAVGLPKSILDHERIIWLGDLNYRINLPYDETCELISNKNWSKLAEKDQLLHELRKGGAFYGWSEGSLNFPPTYKYEINSEKYRGEDPKTGRRVPSWCDRVLVYGKGMKLLKYRRSELKLSDHRPVTATYMAEVEVFSARKLQRALTFTDAEIEHDEVVADLTLDAGMSILRLDPFNLDGEILSLLVDLQVDGK